MTFEHDGAVKTFEVPPKVSLLAAALHPKGDASRGLPHLEARASRLVFDASAYATLCGFGSAEATLPITFLDVATRGLQFAVLTNRAFPFRVVGLVHVSQRIEQHRPIRVNEALSASVFVEGFRVARRGAEFDLHTSVSAGRELVWKGVSTILSQSMPGDGVRREPTADAAFAVERSESWELPADLGRRYAAVSGDYNPIHLYALTAKVFGFSKAIVHGWWSLARCLGELRAVTPERCVVEASFRKPVPLPSTVRFETGRGADATIFTLNRVNVGQESERTLSGSIRSLR